MRRVSNGLNTPAGVLWPAAIAVLALLGFYTWVGWLIANPRVGLEYQMYYMDRVLKVWPGIGGLDYRIGEEIDLLRNPRHLGVEWGSPRKVGWWHIREGVGTVYAATCSRPAGRLKFELEVPGDTSSTSDLGGNVRRVELHVNGVNAGTLTPAHTRPGPAVASVERNIGMGAMYDAALLRCGVNAFRLDAKGGVLPVVRMVPIQSVPLAGEAVSRLGGDGS